MDSFQGIFGGTLLTIGAFLFGYNYKNFQYIKRLKKDLDKNLIEVDQNTNIGNIQQNHPVMVSDRIVVSEPALDQRLGIEFNSPKILRTVYMYQIKEQQPDRKNEEKNKEFSLFRSQKQIKIDYIWSEYFQKGRNNPPFPFKSKTICAPKIKCGSFEFSHEFIKL